MIDKENMTFNLLEQAKKLPNLSGVYLFKDKENQFQYIGKAKNLKKRVLSYFKRNYDWKNSSIIESSYSIDYIVTKNELEAMLLEAKLIQANQPPFNVLLKTGQPFLYIVITKSKKKLPELKIVRNKKIPGFYFGPFLEKSSARIAYNFLIKTFRLKICGKKIENGCLDYHLGICAGSCKSDFDKADYLHRLNLAKMALKKGHERFLNYLKSEIEKYNQNLEFEKSRELYSYYQAFDRVFKTINIVEHKEQETSLLKKDIWILTEDKKMLFLFSEHNSVLSKKRIFYLPFELKIKKDSKTYLDYFISYYRSFNCSNTILINFDLDKKNKKLFELFLKKWHKKFYPVKIINPISGHFFNLIRLAQIHVQQEIQKQKDLALSLKNLLKLKKVPHTIDCFDISHKQGMFMVGSCVRFKDGLPDKNNFRRFKIKTVEHQDDYKSLQEIVNRRYKKPEDFPDLILIDGGKGQLSAVKPVVKDQVEVISIAKKEETVFSDNFINGKKLDQKSYTAQLLIALRDYAHHFAISYHKKLESIIFSNTF